MKHQHRKNLWIRLAACLLAALLLVNDHAVFALAAEDTEETDEEEFLGSFTIDEAHGECGRILRSGFASFSNPSRTDYYQKYYHQLESKNYEYGKLLYQYLTDHAQDFMDWDATVYAHPDDDPPEYLSLILTEDLTGAPSEAERKVISNELRYGYAAFDYDHPAIFWLRVNSFAFSYYGKTLAGGKYRLRIKFELKDDNRYTIYGSDPDSFPTDLAAMNANVATLTALALSRDSIYGKITAINDWLADYNYYNRYVAGGNRDAAAPKTWKSVSALTEQEWLTSGGTGDPSAPACEGYARAFKVICDEIGIPCLLAAGDNHMWNYVQNTDGVWYAVDVTWDDPLRTDEYENKETPLSKVHRYIMVGNDTIVSGKSRTFLEDGHHPTGAFWKGGDVMPTPTISSSAYEGSLAAGISDLSVTPENGFVTVTYRTDKAGTYYYMLQDAGHSALTAYVIQDQKCEIVNGCGMGSVTEEDVEDGTVSFTIAGFPDGLYDLYLIQLTGDEYISDVLCVKNVEPSPYTGWTEVGGKKYYFCPKNDPNWEDNLNELNEHVNARGAMAVGAVWMPDGLLYKFGPDGALEKIWHRIKNVTIDDIPEDAEAASALNTLQRGETYRLSVNYIPEEDGLSEEEISDDQTLHFTSKNPNAVRVDDDGTLHALQVTGSPVEITVTTGDEDNRYHPTAAIMVSVSAPAGWFAVDGNRFYGKKTGTGVSLAEGWQVIGPDTYYFYPGDDTKHVPYSLATGVVKIGSSCYAFDAYGARICEAQAVDGTFLYDGKYYAFDDEGDLYRDTFFDMTVGGKNRTYYANAAGELATGICTFGTGEKRYFADADYALAEEEPVCSMQNGLVIADGNAYYFADYQMQYGYFAAGTEHYYATPAGKSGEGSLQYGAVKVGDQILLFGAPWSTKPYAQIGEAAPKSWIIAGGKRYYLNASGRTLNGFQTIDSKRYFFRSDGSALTGAFMDYYFGETDHFGFADDNYGIMQTGRQYYNGSYYFHAKNGQRLEGWQFDPVSGIWDYYTPEAAGTAHVPPNPTLTDTNWHLYGTQYFYYKNNKTLATSWQTINGKKYYFEPAAGPLKGAMYTGFKKIGNAFYYFGENAADLGILQTGTFDHVRGGETYHYYANNSGVLQLGWQKIAGTWRYFDRNTGYETAAVHGEGWSTAKDSLGTEYRYYFINGRTMATGIRLIEGKYYYFSRNTKDGSLGRLVTGTFFKEGSNVYYADEEGVLQTGELVIDSPSPYEGTYYLNEKRVLLTGWQKIGGTWRYFTTAADVALAPGTRCLGREWTSTDAGGGWYRLSETGVLSPEDDWFYFPNDKNFVKGWKTIGTDKYYFEKDGRMQRDVFAIGKNTYRTHTENAGYECGICYTDEWYVYNHPADGAGTERLQYYKANGMQQTGWKGKYYFAPAESADGRYDRGDMYTGVSAIGKTLYLFDANGQSRRSETVVLAANAPRRITPEMTGTYATNGRGAILTGLKTINKQKYYFDPLTGKMATGFVTIGKKTYCFDENGVMSLGRVSDRGMYYYLGSNGIMKYGWITEGKKKLYADPVSGALAVGFATIDGKTYYFSEEKTTIGELMTGFFHVSDLGQRNYDRSPNASNLYYAYPDGTLHAPGWDVISQSSAKYSQKWSYYFSENIIGYTAAGEAVRGEMAAGDVQMQSDGTVVFLGTLGNLFTERPDIDPLDYYRFDPATGARKKAVLVFYGNYYGEADYTYDWEEEKVTKVTPRISKPQTDIVHSMSKYTNPDRKLTGESDDFYYVNSNRQEEQQKLYTAGLTSYDPAVTTFPMAASKYYPYDDEHPESRLYWAGNDISDPSGAPGDGNVDVYDVEAYSWDVYQLALKKFGPNNLVLLGASSGGGLCLALCQKAAEEGLMQPANTILFSPWVDLAMDNDAIASISPAQSEFMDLGTAKYWAARYTRDNSISEDYRLAGHGDALGVANPFASPLRGTHLGDLSNVVVYTGGYDLFCPDCKLAVDEITKNGGSTELKYYPSMIHAYMFNKSTLNPSVETVHDACRRIMTQ